MFTRSLLFHDTILQSPDLQLDLRTMSKNVSPGQVLGEQQICAGCTVQLEADLSEVPLEGSTLSKSKIG